MNFDLFQLQERVENKSSQANEWEKQTDNLRRELSDKSHRLQQTEHTLAYVKEVLSFHDGLISKYTNMLVMEYGRLNSFLPNIEAVLSLLDILISNHSKMFILMWYGRLNIFWPMSLFDVLLEKFGFQAYWRRQFKRCIS